jgi:hypothetical protein
MRRVRHAREKDISDAAEASLSRCRTEFLASYFLRARRRLRFNVFRRDPIDSRAHADAMRLIPRRRCEPASRTINALPTANESPA